MNLENQFVLCYDTGEVDMQVRAFGQEGFHLVSCTESNGLWYLTFSNWVTYLTNKRNLQDEK